MHFPEKGKTCKGPAQKGGVFVYLEIVNRFEGVCFHSPLNPQWLV